MTRARKRKRHWEERRKQKEWKWKKLKESREERITRLETVDIKGKTKCEKHEE